MVTKIVEKKVIKKVAKKIVKKQKKEPVEDVNEPIVCAPADELKYLRYSVSDQYPCMRNLFLKKDLSNECSLIVSNIPAYLNNNVVKDFLSQFVKTPIIDYYIQRSTSLDGSLSSGQLTGIVTFESSGGVTQALEECESVGPYKISDFTELNVQSVLKSSIALYKSLFSTTEELEESTNNYMEIVDKERLEARVAAKRKRTEPDEEGWVTVTKFSKKVGRVMKLKKTDTPMVGSLKRKRHSVDLAFYSFQAKESKTKKAQELKDKFEEDKKKVAMLKNARKFKPF